MLAFLANVVYLASSSEVSASHSEETSLLAFKDARGSQAESLWTAFTVKDGREVCQYVASTWKTKIRTNILKFISKDGHPQLTAMEFFPIRYSVTDGQPIQQNCAELDNAEQQLKFYVGREASTKPGEAFRDGLSDDEILFCPDVPADQLNFVFEGNIVFSFGEEPLNHVMRFTQAADNA